VQAQPSSQVTSDGSDPSSNPAMIGTMKSGESKSGERTQRQFLSIRKALGRIVI
jgi:hypothetical protein